jgi:hypothetical protein
MQILVHGQQASTQKLIDDNVISPAYAVAEGVDKVCLYTMSHPPVVLIRLQLQRYSSLVDAFEAVFDKTCVCNKPVEPVESEHPYQRAIALFKNLRENVVAYSAEQYTQLNLSFCMLSHVVSLRYSLTT